jgi:magnesium and cobalt transporter
MAWDMDVNDRRISWWEKVFSRVGRLRASSRDLVREMEELIEEGSAEGIINTGEGEMLLSVLEFRRTLVREIMVPRTEMVCVEVDIPLDELIRQMVETGHSRIPVFERTIDHVVGIVHARDILQYWKSGDEAPKVRHILRPAYFVPETMGLETLLGELRRRKTHLAVAVDEYGGVSGLVTLEDVLEEIVGDIRDEYDAEERELLRRTPEGIEADGRCEIELLEEELGRPIEAPGEYETVGGLVSSVLGRIPRAGESFVHAGLRFRIRDADERRVRTIVISRAERQEEPKPNESK